MPACSWSSLDINTYDGECNSDARCTHLCNVTSCCGRCVFVITGYSYCCTVQDCNLRSQTGESMYPCGTDSCYYDSSRRSCTTSCSQTAHYRGNSANGRCEAKSCEARSVNTSAPLVCGSVDCFFDASTGRCGSTCGGNNVGNGESGYCEPKPCVARTPATGDAFPCASSDCFHDTLLGRCAAACSTQSHYREDSASGTCVLRNCVERVPNASAASQCGGSGCYYDDLEKACVAVCPRDSHYKEDTASLLCVLKACEARAVNASAQTPCGSGGCYANAGRATVNPAGTECATTCSNGDHYVATTQTGRCELRACADRKKNTLNALSPCGSDDCYWDMADTGGDGDRCVGAETACAHAGLFGKEGQGRLNHTCILKSCTFRTLDHTFSLWPCGSPDCFYDPSVPAVAGMQCVASCTANSHRSGVEGDVGDGVCVLKACADRSWNASAGFPCGSADCVYDARNEEGHACGALCTDASNYRASLTEGLCVARTCMELGADSAACTARNSSSSGGGLSMCHFHAAKSVCEDVGTYQKRRSTAIVLASVFGGLGVVVVVVVVVIVIVVVRRKLRIAPSPPPSLPPPPPPPPHIPSSSSSSSSSSSRYSPNSSSSSSSSHYSHNPSPSSSSSTPGHTESVRNIPTEGAQNPCVVGGYTLWESLGEGSFGEVYWCTKGGKNYAIKKFKSRKLMREVEQDLANGAGARLNSKFLVRYFEKIDGPHGEQYVVMDLCRKGDLRSLIDSFKTWGSQDAVLNPLRIMKILIQMLLGLEVLHGSHIIHRDLKPENVFIDENDNVKIGDFGCSNTVIGTPLYEAPEVIAGYDYDARADMWSLGVLLYELCTFKWPFYNDNPYRLMELIKGGNPPPIPTLRCPNELRYIVRALLCSNVNRRATAQSLLQHPFVQRQASYAGLLQYYPPRISYVAEDFDDEVAYPAESFLLN